jgi:hypothetical protein
MTKVVNDLLFVGAQFPGSYGFSVFFQYAILPFMPDTIQQLRAYEVVRKVDYMDKKSLYYLYTYPMYLVLLLYFVTQKSYDNDSMFQIYFGILSFCHIFGMEICLQLGGGRRMNLKQSSYASGSIVLSLIIQSLREGSICFGLPAVICAGLLQYSEYPNVFWVSFVAAILDWIGLMYYLLNVKEKFPRILGSTDVLSRRKIVDTIGFRIAEYYIMYYVFQQYPNCFVDNKNLLIVTSVYRTLQHILFFSIRTYFGQTWVDKGAKNLCEDTWMLTIGGIAFRVAETSFCDFIKVLCLAHMTNVNFR